MNDWKTKIKEILNNFFIVDGREHSVSDLEKDLVAVLDQAYEEGKQFILDKNSSDGG